MRTVVSTLERLTNTDTTVLIEGETGTGKDVVAETLHKQSARRDGPFVVFDCGAVPATLIAATLFGHARGAFSSAAGERAGLFEAAEGGTLFLDELGELPLELQPVLLRAIERKTIRRLGADTEQAHDVRIVVATNRNLAEGVRAKWFRQDLFHRVSVVRVRLPPLRDRPEDLPLLAQHFAAEQGAALTQEQLALLSAHTWPGNVRELRNTVARLLFTGDAMEPRTLGPGSPGLGDPIHTAQGFHPLVEGRRIALDTFERRYLEAVLAATEGNVTRAAELAGVSRQVLTRLTAKFGLRVRDRGGSD
jgi:DNA-binding NtrC family response regulator